MADEGSIPLLKGVVLRVSRQCSAPLREISVGVAVRFPAEAAELSRLEPQSFPGWSRRANPGAPARIPDSTPRHFQGAAVP
jgi:hypothetical protein